MGRVLTLSEPSVDMLLYGDKSNFLAGYLTNQMQQIGPAFNEFSQRVYNSIQNSYNYVTDKLLQYGVRNELAQVGLNVLDNQFIALTSWTELQQAPLTMQRWVMCHPELKALYLDQNIDGYSEQYKNVFGNGIGDDDYNYRLMMDGVVQEVDNVVVVKNYYQDLLSGDRELDHYEKDILQDTHSAIEWILRNTKFDFTAVSDEPTKINRS